MSLPTVTDYCILEKIGSGSYATVFRAYKKGDPREIIAMKCIDISSLSKSESNNLVTEINLLKVLKHQHIVEMKDFFWDEKHIYIVMEYCDGGDLSNFIRKRHKLSEGILKTFLQQLALALKYLHENNVCHMDLKPQNLLLMKRPKLILKVGDFGFAQYFAPSEQKFAVRGSPLYMAPEILLRRKYDSRVDLWSVGVIMYECLFGKQPYCSNTFQELAEKIKEMRPIELPRNVSISPSCKDLLLKLLKFEPDERISFQDFFSHDFLDLSHAPTNENFDKAVALVQKAVQLDAEKKRKEAFHAYCEALRYFIPSINSEIDIERKEALRSRVNEYMRRAEKLKNVFVNQDESGQLVTFNHEENLRTTSVSSRRSGLPFNELYTLSKSTTGMPGALEIGETAEQYFAEGNYAIALDKFQSSLNVLVPLLSKEPQGRRRDLLRKQVQYWIEAAESTKGLLATKDIDEQQSCESSEQCILQ